MYSLNALVFLGLIKVIAKLTTGINKSDRCLLGGTAIVTGGASETGNEIVAALASRGCRVIIADIIERNSVQNLIKRTNNENIVFKKMDLASLTSVRKFGADINANEKRIDLLIHNASISGIKEELTEDGLRKITQINHFGPFLLTHLVADLLKRTPMSRIVYRSSIFAFTHNIKRADRINFPLSDIKGDIKYAMTDFSNSKLCAAAAVCGFAERLKKDGVMCNSASPGFVYGNRKLILDQNIYGYLGTMINITSRAILYIYGKTPQEGAQTILFCALHNQLNRDTGKYFIDCKSFMQPPLAQIWDFRKRFWEISEQLVNLKEEEKLK